MSRQFQATFTRQEDLLPAVSGYRESGFEIVDVYTPYAVHGLDEAAGVRRTRLGWVCAVLGLGGAVAMLLFEHWSSAVSWPLNVGGKPLSSIPAFVPVMFEAGVLAAGLGSVFAFFVVSRLFPGKRVYPHLDRVSDDRFTVVLQAADQGFQWSRAESISQEHGAENWCWVDPPSRPEKRPTITRSAARWH